MLKPNGKIFLQIPSADALAAKMLKEECNMFDGLEHVNLYSHRSLKTLADRCDLAVISIETVIAEIGVMNNYLSYQSPYFGDASPASSVIDLISEEQIHKNLLGYKFQVVLS